MAVPVGGVDQRRQFVLAGVLYDHVQRLGMVSLRSIPPLMARTYCSALRASSAIATSISSARGLDTCNANVMMLA